MRVVMLEAPQALLDERRRLGLAGRDEMWGGVLHVVPPAEGPHQGLSSEFFLTAGPVAKARGLVPRMGTGLFRTADDYRVPDQLHCLPGHLSERGAEGAELVVLHPTPRRAELYRLVEDRLPPVQADAAGELASDVLGVRVRAVPDALRLTWDGGSADV
jgi:hypothetical protein